MRGNAVKRNLVIVLLYTVIICLCTTACSSSLTADLSNISVLEIGSSADLSDEGYDNIWSSENCNAHSDLSAPQKMQITFNGNKFNGDYLYSYIELYNLHPSDYYDFSGGCFSVNRESGQLETIIFTNFGSGDKSVEECKKYAEEMASQYIDTSQYKLESVSGDFVHGYHYIKTIDGIETSDRLSVAISTSGDIATFSNFTNNGFSKTDETETSAETNNLIKKFLSPHAINMIEDKIYSIYENCSSYKIVNKKLVRLENNKLGMVYTLDIEFEPVPAENNTFDIMSARIELLVCEGN